MTTLKIIVSSIIVLLCCSDFAYSQCNTRAIVLENGRIIDWTGTDPKEGWDISICEGKILAIGQNLSIPDNAIRIDVSGLSILPGLIDMHGHLFVNQGSSISNQQSYLNLYLAGGVTTIYSPGEFDANGILELQKKVNQLELQGPDILTAGPIF